MKKIKSFLPFCCLFILLILAQYLFFKALEMQTVTDYLTKTLKIDRNQLIGLFTNFLTGIVTVSLAAVVFYQNKGINDLKSTILGTSVEDIQLDYSVDKEKSDYTINILLNNPLLAVSHVMANQRHELWIRLRNGEISLGDMAFPILVKTKSSHPVTELKLKKISYQAMFNGNTIIKKETIKTQNVSIKGHFCEHDQILFALVLTINDSKQPNKIETTYYCQLIHQNGYKQIMKINVILESVSNDEKFHITSYGAN